MDNETNCPRCGEIGLRAWSDLNDDEREVVPRLPQARNYSIEERQKSHLWCTRCWYESIEDAGRTA